jgi:hypothetical protein
MGNTDGRWPLAGEVLDTARYVVVLENLDGMQGHFDVR